MDRNNACGDWMHFSFTKLIREKEFSIKVFILFFILFVALSSLAYLSPINRWGDTSTYYMMIDSISNDRDIKYECKDIQRAFKNQFDDLPAGLFLAKGDNSDFYYAKEYTYPFFASFFYFLLKNKGLLVFNSILFFLLIVLGYKFLTFKNKIHISFIISFMFFIFSTAFIYIFWIHPEIYIMFLVALSFFLWSVYVFNNSDNYWGIPTYLFLYLSAIVFAVSTFSKLPNFIGILPLIIYELNFKRYKSIFTLVLGYLFTLFLLYYLYYLISGNFNPYYHQYYYVGSYPFWNNSEINCQIVDLFLTNNPIKTSFFYAEGTKVAMINLFYYFFGRFTGIIWYYPFVLISIYLYIRFIRINRIRSEQQSFLFHSLIFISILLNILLYIYIDYDSPFNYFGGTHAIGNRYFYFYPAFIFLINKINVDLKFLISIIITLLLIYLFVFPIISNPIEVSETPMEHTIYFPYNKLPIEYTQLDDIPLWNPPPVYFNNETYYFPSSKLQLISNSSIILLENSANIIVKSRVQKEHILKIMALSNNTNITLSYGKIKKHYHLKGGEVISEVISTGYAFNLSNTYITNINVLSDDLISSNNILLSFEDTMTNTILFTNSFYGQENWEDIPTRWMQSDSTLAVFSPRILNANISLDVLSFYHNRTLEIYSGNALVTRAIIPTSFLNVSAHVALEKGLNILRLHVPEGCERPSDRQELNNPDSRCLSIAVQNITVT